MFDSETNKKWWMFQGEFYWEKDGLSQNEVKALALERTAKNEKRISRAVSMMENSRCLKISKKESRYLMM